MSDTHGGSGGPILAKFTTMTDYQIIGYPMKAISATKAARNFSDLLNRVAYRHESVEINRGGRAVARLIPVESILGVRGGDLSKFLADLPSLGDEVDAFAADVESARATPEDDAWAS